MWHCTKCKKELPVEEVFVIRHGRERQWNMEPLCEGCCDEILKRQEEEHEAKQA